MDEIDLLRRVRADVATPSTTALAPARAKLLARTAGGSPRRRRTPLLLAGAAALVLAVAAGLVVTNPFATAPASAAADLLHHAADRAADRAATAPGPGQYLAVETHEESLGYVNDDAQRIVGGYQTRTTSVTYVPHERDDVWVRRYWSQRPGEVYGGAAVRRAAARDYAVSAHADAPGVEEGPGGRFGNGELGGGSAGITVADLDTLPRDPARLLERLVDAGSVGADEGRAAIEGASTLLRTGLAPLDLRRSLFWALALVPGVEIVDDTVAMSGRSGTAIGVRVDGYGWSVVIDPDSGDFLGELQTQLRPMGAVPAGTAAYRTTLSLTVVDELPRP